MVALPLAMSSVAGPAFLGPRNPRHGPRIAGPPAAQPRSASATASLPHPWRRREAALAGAGFVAPLLLRGEPALGAEDGARLFPYVDEENGFKVSLPRGWRSELGNYTDGTPRLDWKPPRRVDTRISIAVTPAGKLSEVSMAAYAASIGLEEVDSRTWGLGVAREASGEGKTAAVATLVGSGERDGGRIYAWEWTLDSILPTHAWGASGLGEGPNPTARRLKLRSLVTVTATVPEAEAEGELGELARACAESFTFL